MNRRLKVLFYGDTLVLAGLRASLLSYSNFDIIDCAGREACEEEVYNLGPDIVIFDVGAVQPKIQQVLTEKLPNLLMVGIDPSCNRGLVWSRHDLHELSTSDLVEMFMRFFA